MNLKVMFDWSKGGNGVIFLALHGAEDKLVDQEVVRFRCPFLLRLRLRMAFNRMNRRQAKIAKFLENVAK
jgi:hypothetical protein